MKSNTELANPISSNSFKGYSVPNGATHYLVFQTYKFFLFFKIVDGVAFSWVRPAGHSEFIWNRSITKIDELEVLPL